MASPSYFIFVISLCVSVTLLYPICCYGLPFIIFGDSLYDPGNMKYTKGSDIPSNHWPYGMSFFNPPSGRFSDGRVAPDFIASSLNISFIPAVLDPEADFTNGVSFATGGAGVFDDHTNTLNLKDQLNHLNYVVGNWTHELGEEKAKRKVKNGVYLFCLGGNDYFSFIFGNPNATVVERQAYVDLVIGNLTNGLKQTYDLGARKFVFQNVAPIGCLPMMKQTFEIVGDGCASFPLSLAQLHNAALHKAAIALESELSGFTYSIFDYYNSILDRINNPTDHGFQAGDVACCGYGSHRADNCGTKPFEVCENPHEYVFFDGGHGTDTANGQMADLMYNGTSEFIAPYNMKYLFELDPTIKISSKESGWVAAE